MPAVSTKPSVKYCARIVLALSFAAAPVWADDSVNVREWLEKMSHAPSELNYHGTFVYMHNKQMLTMQITHKVDADGEHERLVSLNGAGRQILRDDNSITVISASELATLAKTRPRQPFPAILRTDIDELTKYYDFSLAGEERIADHTTQRILVQPKDNYRYGYRFWVDKASGLLLKADMVREANTPVEQLMFTEITLESSPKKPHVNQAADQLKSAEEARHALVEDAGWKVTGPDGFKLVEHTKYPTPMNALPVDHLVLSDGLAAVSVFIEKFDAANDKFIGSSRRGAVNAFGTVNEDHQITVVGEVPQATVQLIGESVKRAGEP